MPLDSFSGPPQDKYGFPGINYPTANPRDVLIVEEYPAQAGPFHALGYGTPHDKDASCLLCWQSQTHGTANEKNVRRYYANPRLAQEPYNLTNGGSEENDPAFPRFVRSYLLPRNYTHATLLLPLTAIIRLTLTNGGTGYGVNAQIALIFTGGAGSGAAGFAEVVGGVIQSVFLTNSGTGYTSGGLPTISAAGGTGLAVTVVIQPVTCLLTDETETPAEEPYLGYFVRVTRTWDTLPGPQLLGSQRTEEIRGRTITINTQKVASGTGTLQTGAGILASSITPLNKAIDEVVSKSYGTLPPTEVWGFWGDVNLPTLIFDITHTAYCNNTQFGVLVTNYLKGAGSSVIRKHRRTVTYYDGPTPPDPDLSDSAFAPTDMEYAGKIIHINENSVLNDHITFSGDFIFSSSDSACGWTESYDFPATTPSATDFAAGMWITRSFDVERWGDVGWKSTQIEYYSGDGNPSIT